MNIKNAKKKLREARFFLNYMIEQERKAGDEELFDFYLSAFLSAGMSVRDAFHVEQDRNRNNAIKAWKKVWEVRLTPEEKRLYDFMREDRKHEVHRSGSSRKAGTENRELGPGTHKLACRGYVAGDCLRSCRLSASQQCGDEAAENRRSATAKKVGPSNATFVRDG